MVLKPDPYFQSIGGVGSSLKQFFASTNKHCPSLHVKNQKKDVQLVHVGPGVAERVAIGYKRKGYY